MSIIFQESSRTFHLFNDKISYIMTVLPNRQMGQLYFGKRIHQKRRLLLSSRDGSPSHDILSVRK